MEYIEYMRPSGNPLKVPNDEASIAYAESLGWVRVDEQKKPKGRPRKVTSDSDS